MPNILLPFKWIHFLGDLYLMKFLREFTGAIRGLGNRTMHGRGGATVRKVADMIRICETNTNQVDNEDSWMADRINENGDYLPTLSFRAEMIMESLPSNNPVILHQFWTFLDQYMGFPNTAFIGYWKHLLIFG